MFRPAAFRATLRQAAPKRAFATEAAAENDFIKTRQAIEHHAKDSAELWRKITYYVALPAIVVGALNAKALADDHEHHLEHIKEENGGELPERIKYPCQGKLNWSSKRKEHFTASRLLQEGVHHNAKAVAQTPAPSPTSPLFKIRKGTTPTRPAGSPTSLVSFAVVPPPIVAVAVGPPPVVVAVTIAARVHVAVIRPSPRVTIPLRRPR
ncbi:hypothetical protein JCM21900_005825 [Sporobolomyces salmonicolor]